MTFEKRKRKYGVEVNIHTPKVPYKETIRKAAQAQGKYKKQTGGHGQYGDCWLELAPSSRGEGFAFTNRVVGGVIPRNFIPAVEKGVIEAMQHGTLAGFPVVDVRVAVYDGSYHVVDSSEMSFKIAASMAFKKAMESAHPVLLEPMMTVEVEAPAAVELARQAVDEMNPFLCGPGVRGGGERVGGALHVVEVRLLEHDAVLHDLGEARSVLALRQGREQLDVGKDKARLVERADQVLDDRGRDVVAVERGLERAPVAAGARLEPVALADGVVQRGVRVERGLIGLVQRPERRLAVRLLAARGQQRAVLAVRDGHRLAGRRPRLDVLPGRRRFRCRDRIDVRLEE